MLAYLTHVGAGQLRLLWSRESPTPERLAALPPEERAGYQTFQSALAFGESLGLAHTTSYRQLTDTGKDWLVQVVTAAPANELVPITWWFPIVGSVSYRGYFDPERAQRFAAELAARDLDVYVRPSPLYTTLGWFEDALPRSLLAWPEEDLVDTALHEQVHLTVYIESDVAYNEGLATFTAHQATLAMLRERPELAARARASFADELTYARMLNELRAELDALYASSPTPEDARARRAPIFARYQREVYAAQPWQSQRFARFQKVALSNAWVVANRDYLGLMPCFERELADLGGDLSAFVRAHREKPGHRPAGCEATP
ncbi:MAG: aminopeptidase [Myxococcota bacterium]